MSDPTNHVVECFWPGIEPADLADLDARAAASAAGLGREGASVAYRGSLLLREDEVVLCFFVGAQAAVVEAMRRAEIAYERILEGVPPAHLPIDPIAASDLEATRPAVPDPREEA